MLNLVLFELMMTSALAGNTHIVDGATQTHTHTCETGQAVQIIGTSMTVTLTGDCGALTVRGSNNTVAIDGVVSIDVTGSSQTVTWTRNLSELRKLPVSKTGYGNKVNKVKGSK